MRLIPLYYSEYDASHLAPVPSTQSNPASAPNPNDRPSTVEHELERMTPGLRSFLQPEAPHGAARRATRHSVARGYRRLPRAACSCLRQGTNRLPTKSEFESGTSNSTPLICDCAHAQARLIMSVIATVAATRKNEPRETPCIISPTACKGVTVVVGRRLGLWVDRYRRRAGEPGEAEPAAANANVNINATVTTLTLASRYRTLENKR
ncbi:hypothetical protein EVG20_g11003 [Dentipellis fragilis]|uniref:Uncharacterized protein n=1 Tax=Dentipellis fragilis TaxID=205917 RepID=A0A4Y9XQG0_9AGAM|nr:hypothetical protein EVG20_g11003 [Dentipellis fragilis]